VRIETEYGPAEAELDRPGGAGKAGGAGKTGGAGRRKKAAFLLVLTHGSGGGVGSPDLLAARAAALSLGGAVARVLQPYRVRGARAPGTPPRQDAAWLEVIAALRAEFPGLPLVQGGRSNGARVACRTAQAAGASGVVALAFPLHPPGKPDKSRADELLAAGTDVLVLNGSRDPFGIPEAGTASKGRANGAAGSTRVVVLAGETHALGGSSDLITAEVTSWLSDVLRRGA
jgi:uncharacterized protein